MMNGIPRCQVPKWKVRVTCREGGGRGGSADVRPRAAAAGNGRAAAVEDPPRRPILR